MLWRDSGTIWCFFANTSYGLHVVCDVTSESNVAKNTIKENVCGVPDKDGYLWILVIWSDDHRERFEGDLKVVRLNESDIQREDRCE